MGTQERGAAQGDTGHRTRVHAVCMDTRRGHRKARSKNAEKLVQIHIRLVGWGCCGGIGCAERPFSHGQLHGEVKSTPGSGSTVRVDKVGYRAHKRAAEAREERSRGHP